eukprot:NP_509380.1 Uncharacterized protein CELE_C17H11.4 [Caenorhabditis elegans]
MSWIEVQFLRQPVDALSECRRTLKYAYAFAYYLEANNLTTLFETNQSDLELATEQLSGMLEGDLEDMDLAELKRKVQDKYRYVKLRRKKSSANRVSIFLQHKLLYIWDGQLVSKS